MVGEQVEKASIDNTLKNFGSFKMSRKIKLSLLTDLGSRMFKIEEITYVS